MGSDSFLIFQPIFCVLEKAYYDPKDLICSATDILRHFLSWLAGRCKTPYIVRTILRIRDSVFPDIFTTVFLGLLWWYCPHIFLIIKGFYIIYVAIKRLCIGLCLVRIIFNSEMRKNRYKAHRRRLIAVLVVHLISFLIEYYVPLDFPLIDTVA